MRVPMRLLIAALAALSGCGRAQPLVAPVVIPRAVNYADPAMWICRPGRNDGTCTRGFDAMTIDAAGRQTPRPAKAAANPPIDCFYVYPTTTSDHGTLSDLAFDESERGTVRAQLARLGEACRLFAPGYHQRTGEALGRMMRGNVTSAEMPLLEVPYRDVRDAWRHYLAHDNGARGVVLIGHSQGAGLVRRLLREEVDGTPAQARLAGAYLAGNRDLTPTSFAHIQPCAARGQIGCVVAWSSYRTGDQVDRRFGLGADALCVNPANPGGDRAMLDAFLEQDDPPVVELTGQLSAECVRDSQGAVLRVRAEPGPNHDRLEAMLAAHGGNWGLHPLDIALVQGNLLADIAAQGAAWRARGKP